MKLFLSWSGRDSHAVADILRSWLPGVLPSVEPWLASEDIPKGAAWSSAIAEALKTAGFGILCITEQNLGARWLNYEAGALAHAWTRAKVAPLLFGVPPSDVSGPLAQYQLTVFERRDVLRLLRTINAECGGRALSEDTLTTLFDRAWPRLERSIGALRTDVDDHVEPEEVGRPYEPDSDDDEVLELLANLPEREGRDWGDVDDLVRCLGMRTRRAEYILNVLTDNGFLDESEDDDGNPIWSLSTTGLHYVVEAQLLDE